jgi:hypothetical protein
MNDRAIEDGLQPSVVKRVAKVTRLQTYETAKSDGSEGPIASPVDDELRERLRSLGYIQ